MSVLNNLFQNKNVLPVLLGVLLLVYLYLDTPLPFVLMLNNFSLLVAILVSLVVVCYLCKKTNVFVAIIFALVAFEVIKKSINPSDPNNLNRNVQYYDNLNPANSNVVISDRLKKSNTLEQEMVENMIPEVEQEQAPVSARYQALLPDLGGASQLD